MATDISAAINAVNTELMKLANQLSQMVNGASKTAAANEANRKATEELNDELDEYNDNLVKGRKLTDKQLDLQKQANAARAEEIKSHKALTQAQQAAAQAAAQFGQNSQQAAQAQAAVTAAQQRYVAAQNNSTTTATNLTTSFTGLTKGTRVAEAAVSWFGNTLRAQTQQLISQQRANSGLVEGSSNILKGLIDQQMEGLKRGVSGEQMAQVVAANRQMVNAAGGTAQALEKLNPTIDRYRILTGSSEEALRLAAQAATQFAERGVKPTIAGMRQYSDDVVKLAKYTGMNVEASQAYYNELANDAEMTNILRQARAGEREAILANQRALVNTNLALGMTAAQAKEAAKTMNQMVGAKPLDRIRQAAKVRALGGAMGIEGSDAAAQAIMAGPRATAEQKAALQRFNTNAANTSANAAQQGMGAEIVTTALVDKLGFGDVYGKNSPFATTMADALKPSEQAIKSLVDSSQTMQGKMFGQAVLLNDQARQILSGTNIIGVGVAGIAALLSAALLRGGGGAIASAIGSAGAATGAGVAARAAGLARGAAAGGVMMAAGAGVDYVAGKAGVGGNQINEAQDEANWNRMSAGQKVESGIARAIEKVGGIAFLDNMANEARANRIKSETSYLDQNSSKGMGEELAENSTKTASGIEDQLKEMTDQTSIMSILRDNSTRQIELSEKMLVALTLTDAERSNAQTTASLRRDNKFASTYNYVN